MNKYLILAILIALLFFIWTLPVPAKAEGLYLTLGAGENGQFWNQGTDNWNDEGGTGAFFVLSYQWDKQEWCFRCRPSLNYAHISQWEVSGDEDWVDHVGVAGTWTLFER